jgi:hypothetical protein
MTHATFVSALDVVRGKNTHRKNPGKRGKQGGSVSRHA